MQLRKLNPLHDQVLRHPTRFCLQLLAGGAAIALAVPAQAKPSTPEAKAPAADATTTVGQRPQLDFSDFKASSRSGVKASKSGSSSAIAQTADLTPMDEAAIVADSPSEAPADEDLLIPVTPNPANPDGAGPTSSDLAQDAGATPSFGDDERCPCELDLTILSPDEGALFDGPSGIVVIRYDASKSVELEVNGETVDRSQVGRTERDELSGTVTETWYGVTLEDGRNSLTARTEDEEQSVTVMVRGQAQRLTLSTVESRVPADGRSVMTVEGQVLDSEGNLSNRETLVTLASSAGNWLGDDADRLQDGFQVLAENGTFTAQLQSTLKAQKVQIRAAMGRANEGQVGRVGIDAMGGTEVFTQAEFDTNLRPSIATGVISLRLGGEGNDYYGKLRDFLPLDEENDFTIDLKGQAFAMGAVGDWLLTGAYNSDRNLNESCDETNQLFRVEQPCEHRYSTYGDGSTTEVLAPSIDSFYLKLERTSPVENAGTDEVMWGDYRTDAFSRRSQQFTALTRELHGFSGTYNFNDLEVSAFFGNNVEGFQRDTIVPDGTSGFYFLSRRALLSGSENVFLELEELNRPGTVVQRVPMIRGQDYSIDYDRGSIIFTDPILRTAVGKNGETLVRRIVSTYQFDDGNSDTNIYGGRLQYNFSRERGRESWVAATAIREDRGSRDYSLYGVDGLASLGDRGTLIGEFARSNNESEVLGDIDGSAVRLELAGDITDTVSGNAYFRKADTGFSNNATVSFVPGQMRYGANVNAAVGPTTTLRFQADREENEGEVPTPRLTFGDLFNPQFDAPVGLDVDNSLTTISAGVLQKVGRADASLDWIYRDRNGDVGTTDLDESSHQIRSRVEVPLAERWTALLQNETTLSSDVDPIFSDRTLLGLNWRISDGVNAELAQQFFHRGQYAGKQLTSFGVSGDYNLTPNTLLRSRYTVLNGADDMRMQGAVGLQQDIPISPKLKAELGLERVFGNLLDDSAAGVTFSQPFAFGQSASALGVPDGTSYFGGLNYVGNKVQGRVRLEQRNSSNGPNRVVTAAAAGKLSPALTAVANYQQASGANQNLENLGTSAKLKTGLAYRDPNSDKFNALMRYEYRKNPSIIPDTILFGEGTGYHEHLLGLEAVYAPNWQWEMYGKFALRNSVSYLAEDLVGSSTISLLQGRLTHRFAQRWDVTGEARWINQNSTGFSETGLLGELGYYINPNLRLAGGYSFGRADDKDFTGTRTVGGPYFGVSLKLDSLFQGFGVQDWPEPAYAVESATDAVVEPVELPTEQPVEQPTEQPEFFPPETSDPLPVIEPAEPAPGESVDEATGSASDEVAPPIPALW